MTTCAFLGIKEWKIETSDAYVYARLVSFVSCGTYVYTIHGGRHGTAQRAYNEVLLTPRRRISISLFTASASYRYYSSCVAQEGHVASFQQWERTSSFGSTIRVYLTARARRCTGRVRFYARVTTQTIATYIYTRIRRRFHRRSWFSRVNYRAAVYRDHRRVIVPAIGEEQSRAPLYGFSSQFLAFPSLHERIALLMIQQFRLPIGYDFQPGIFEPKYH